MSAKVRDYAAEFKAKIMAQNGTEEEQAKAIIRGQADNVVQLPTPKVDAPPPPIVEPGWQTSPQAVTLGLDPQAPLDNAREFAARYCSRNGASQVWFWGGEFWRWNGQYYAPWSKEEIRGQVYLFLDGAVRKNTDNVRFRPKKQHVEELLDGLRSCLALSSNCIPPMWLNTREPAGDWIVFRNCIVNVVTCEERELTHLLWTQSGLGFDWDRDAECPTWERFCDDLFGDDPESVMFLEEFMGYCMTGDTRFEKGGMFIGPRRSGKSTIVELIGELSGGAIAGLSFNDWLATPKSAQVVLGKRVLAFSDVRLKPGKMWGQNYDPGGIDHRSCELMLKITGRDKVSIGRMYDEAWEGYLPAKIVLTSNEIPNFNDASGVLPTRFIKLQFRRSFAGCEDVNLKAKLRRELPGIAAYCMGAYQRLCKRGQFIQPASAMELERAVARASEPFAAAVNDCLEYDGKSTTSKRGTYGAIEQWCNERGRRDVLAQVPYNDFGDHLRKVAGFERVCDAPRSHGQPRAWFGIRIRKREG
jgi:putative DNA primase/helicase